MNRLLLVACVALGACSAHAGPFRAQPAPLAETPPQPALFLQAFQDARSQRALWRGRGRYEDISVEAVGLSLAAKAWDQRSYGDVAFLWQRQLAQALGKAGLPNAAAEEPLDDAAALARAGELGARLLLRGRLKRFDIEKRGADAFFGTNFSGTNYNLRAEARLELLAVPGGEVKVGKDWSFERRFYDPNMLGTSDYETFPSFFLVGLGEACADLAGDPDLRTAAGLPTYTPTPTVTSTPLAVPPPAGTTPTPAPTATPAPTPDNLPYWVNPKTGKRVDPKWNFDPSDGTPRKDFILRNPEPTPETTPRRVTAPR